MLRLTGENVDMVLQACTPDFDCHSNYYGCCHVESISTKPYELELFELEKHRHLIENFFRQIKNIDEEFVKIEDMIRDKNGLIWGDFCSVEQLVALGFGLDIIKFAREKHKYPRKLAIELIKENFQTPTLKDSTGIRKLSEFGLSL